MALMAVLCFSGLCRGQWLQSNVYDMPLQDVLSEVEGMYGVKFAYKEKNIKGKVVTYARWKYRSDLDSTLDGILVPLGLKWARKGGNKVEISNWEYYRLPEEEGRIALEKALEKYDSVEKWVSLKKQVRENIVSVLGIGGLPHGDLNPIRVNFRKHDGYTVENIALEILPGVWVCGSLYMPILKKLKNVPFMLCPHGHFYNKEDNSIPDERGRYRPDQQLRCATLARMGVAVFSYDMFGWGDSMLAFSLKDHRTDLGIIMQTWQSIRILDWCCSLPWVDKDRIGVTAASGGGTQTMIIAALDDRIRLSVPVVMTSAHFFGGCPCESGLPIHFLKDGTRVNKAELAAMAAPVPQLVISDGDDWTKNVPVVEYPFMQRVYALYGAAGEVENAHFAKEKHDYGPSKRAAMYEFVVKKWHLDPKKVLSPSGTFDESRVTVEPATQMYVFGPGGKLPSHAVHGANALRSLLESYR